MAPKEASVSRGQTGPGTVTRKESEREKGKGKGVSTGMYAWRNAMYAYGRCCGGRVEWENGRTGKWENRIRSQSARMSVLEFSPRQMVIPQIYGHR